MSNYRTHHKSQAANSTGQPQEGSLGPWQDAQPGLQFGAVWVLLGLASYITLSVIAKAVLHSPQALQQQQQQVPSYIYDRSLFVFGTAFLLDVLGLLFELKSSRLDVVLLPAFVKGAATLTNGLMRSGWATVTFSSSGKIVMVQRFVCWLHTTPTILVLVKMMATNITRQQAVRAIVFVEVMCVTGLLGSLTTGCWAVFWGGLSHLAFLPILPYLHQGLKEASAVVSLHAARPTMAIVYYLTMLMWIGFGVVWDLRLLGLINTRTEEVAYLCCDFSAKVMFSAGLMLSSFKGLDSRREVVMRQIQEAHKQTLILELKCAIEQKDAFMSSVSHELRTPLNGIIGISEGLLANCCGPLSESVRKQLFIVRTSGARLLALINDVMDAATLRQHRLVLKQERLELRQLVGDVVDLTRSLVDADVSLRNDVPEGLEVWADSGRIIQILNNLLGNAAKFTHQGFIRVSAKWHDEQRQWVVIQVTDTGIGIPKQKLQSIFLPFEQVDGSISRQYGGFGLGLSITQELVKAHGGELWVKSRAHKGSQFAFTIASYTGQKPLTPQQQQQLQSRRSTPLAKSTAVVDAVRRRSSSRALTVPVLPLAAAAAAAEDGSCNGTTGAADKHPASAVNGDATAAVAGCLGSNVVESPPTVVPGSALTADLLDSCVGEDFVKELPYDAAQLSALASSKPFIANSPTSSSGSGSLQRVGSGALHHANSMLSLSAAVDGDGLDVTTVPNRDQRPSQFACTGRYQVLSIDDDPVNQTVVQSLLASTGYEVVCLYNGQQTLEYIEKADVLPDLILLDMLMPDMSGPDVCRQLALRQPPLGVPIILVSALAEESSVVTGLDSGADDYITKPFRRAEFLARIRGKLQLATVGAAAKQARQASAPAAGGVSGEERVVMCITDDEVNHIVLEGILHSQNYRYHKVSSGAEALKLLEAAGSTPPHLVLLDAALPDTTGLEVLQTLRQQFSQVALPVIMLTARHNEKSIVQALDAGANDYAVKPFRRSELLARIRMHLRSSQKAAAAVSPVARHSAELSFAGVFDADRVSVEVQRGVRLQQLSTVPLLVIQLGGVSKVLAGASAEQACELMGFIADCFDSVVEKFAVIKVDASDTSLTVAAPLSIGSNQNSARNSFQLPLLQLSTAGNSNSSIMFPAHAADGTAGSTSDAAQQQLPYGAAAAAAAAAVDPAAGAAGALCATPASALAVAMLQLLQMGQELQAHLGVDCAPSTGSSSPGSSPTSDTADVHPTVASRQQQPVSCVAQPSAQQQEGAEGGSRARPRTPLQLMQPHAPQWWHGQLQVHMGLHVGPLTAGVVGRRRPRYRLIGPAVQVARQACKQAPANRTAVTADAAQLLQASGVQSLKRLSGVRSAQGAAEWQLWVLNAGAAAPALQQLAAASLRAGAAAGVSTDAVLNQAAAALADGAGGAGKGFGAPLMHIGSVDPTASASSDGGVDAGAPRGVVAAGPALQPPQLAPQQQQQQHMDASTGAAAAVTVQAVNGLLPPLPPLSDPALQASQQLLMQELAVLAQQLSAACMPSLVGPLSMGMQPSWSQAPQCPPLNRQLVPVVSAVQRDSKDVNQTAAVSQKDAVLSAVGPYAAALTASSELVSASLSLHDWQGSPKQVSAQQLSVRSSKDVQDSCAPADVVNGSAAAAANCALCCVPADAAAAVSCGLQLSGPAWFPAGVQLGPAEMQQISMLHHELATLQQQITSALAFGGMTNGFVSGMSQCMPGYGTALQQQQYGTPHDVQHPQHCSSTGVATSADGSSNVPGTRGSLSAAEEPPAAAAAAADRGVHCSSSSSSGRSSGAGSSAAVDLQRQGDGSTAVTGQQQQKSNSSSRGRPRGQFLRQLLLRRRSSKQQQQQPD